jgi:hypothetical protein
MSIKTGPELQALRKAAADRFEVIAKKHTPADVKVSYVKGLYGRAFIKERRLYAPRPVTRRSLHIYLHEVAHIVLHDKTGKPRHLEEAEAEKWAFAVMRAEGVSVPRKSLRRAKSHVARKIKQAIRRGAKRISPEARGFSGLTGRKVKALKALNAFYKSEAE